jgi:hypothetical protein
MEIGGTCAPVGNRGSIFHDRGYNSCLSLSFKNFPSSNEQHADNVDSKNCAMAVTCERGSMEQLLVETAARDDNCTIYP